MPGPLCACVHFPRVLVWPYVFRSPSSCFQKLHGAVLFLSVTSAGAAVQGGPDVPGEDGTEQVGAGHVLVPWPWAGTKLP